MQVCIHRGARQIGGTCIEIEADGKRLVLDVGLPLDTASEETPLPAVSGFDRPDASLLGVVISHPHQDHYGLAERLPAGTPFLIGKAAQRILEAALRFSRAGLRLENVRHLADRCPIELGPFTITPYLVDHSAYDSYAIHVEAGGRGLFYTGDLRAHGRKGRLFEALIASPPTPVDVLLMEGTRVGRAGVPEYESEAAVEEQLKKVFTACGGMVLVWCSGQNIDRLVSVARACIRSRRLLILDLYTAEILRATGNNRLPQADWDFVRVFATKAQRVRIQEQGAFHVIDAYRQDRIFPEQLAGTAPKAVMIFRPSMCGDLDRAGCLSGARLVYSLWPGYLSRPESRPVLDWLDSRGIPLETCHASGHATVEDLARLREAFPHAPVVPVHTREPEGYEHVFGHVIVQSDGLWWRF